MRGLGNALVREEKYTTSFPPSLIRHIASPVIRSVNQRHVGKGRRQGWVVRGRLWREGTDFLFQHPDKAADGFTLQIGQPLVGMRESCERSAGSRKIMNLISYRGRVHEISCHAFRMRGDSEAPQLAINEPVRISKR